ncbi:MAG TPA: MCE family protein [Gordonia sp. (in: high G+C Gram-positive bacteria)]|uniref:MCE family protein n=1 Tax=unclassified Gordonia (in: high G+C Gram-positive bacteria) TaxID=2657482 RepID=UPI0025C23F21|nr:MULTISPECIES: MCE family protein [unclassified Gordonia (in: high G+C Gram-positive bacteria)]HNP55805.1 MCE family protein [Gordonia sp. (in: high G+C Gram-positive bacteria)]HRC51584.1 MCE family protein [Gordonia sp. (in: high G+C Gram-positive bacteria)]
MAFRQVREVRVRKRYGGKVMTVLLLVTALVYGSWYFLLRDPQIRTVGADFAFVNGLYTGSKVTILGVPVGRVEELTPKGDHVHVRMTLPRDIELPADVGAYVLNPSVISDRHLELAPVYTAGPKFPQDGTIPRERTKAPISFDQLMGSLGTLTKILGPSDAPGATDVGTLLNRTAQAWQGKGTDFNQALTELSVASGVFGARADDIGGLITSLNQLMTTFQAKQVSLDGLIRSMGDLSAQWQAANQDVATPIKDLRTVFDQINGFVMAHGNDVGTVAANLDELGKVLVANRAGFAEFMDLAPLMLQNLSSTIGPDRRGRIRLNVSTTLTQFKTLKPLCDRFPMPLCIGAGLTNPIGFPISSSDPLGIVSAITGGQLPPKPGQPR